LSSRKGGGLSNAERDALLTHVVARGGAKRPVLPEQPKERRTPDFSGLPGYRELIMQRSLGTALGFDDPFYRLHEGRAGPETRIGGRTFLNFSSYDYLGLNGHPDVTNAAKAAVDLYGTSPSASRLTAGERPVHRELETGLAEIYGAEACVCMVSGHATNVTTIGHLVGAKDLVVYDSMAHNSILVGAKLSGAERRSFAHNDISALDALLSAIRDRYENVLIAVEGLYSMDGDYPDLAALIDVKRRYGAWLMVDEAHSLGVLGRRGYGLFEHFDINPREVDIWMGTLSKTLSACGGYIAGSAQLIDYLKFIAGGYVYSVGMSPVLAAAAVASLDLMRREPERVARLQANGAHFVERARKARLNTGLSAGHSVVPIIVGDSLRTVSLAQRIYNRGVYALPIIPPGVPDKSARLRFFITSEHSKQQIEQAVAITAEEAARLG
jgi:8-amino-7-oxononanoate synthase